MSIEIHHPLMEAIFHLMSVEPEKVPHHIKSSLSEAASEHDLTDSQSEDVADWIRESLPASLPWMTGCSVLEAATVLVKRAYENGNISIKGPSHTSSRPTIPVDVVYDSKGAWVFVNHRMVSVHEIPDEAPASFSDSLMLQPVLVSLSLAGFDPEGAAWEVPDRVIAELDEGDGESFGLAKKFAQRGRVWLSQNGKIREALTGRGDWAAVAKGDSNA